MASLYNILYSIRHYRKSVCKYIQIILAILDSAKWLHLKGKVCPIQIKVDGYMVIYTANAIDRYISLLLGYRSPAVIID